MPTYEYGCDACGHEFACEQSIKDDPIKVCPKCKKRKVKRLISQGNFILKGGGWYSDLYSGPSNKKAGSAGSGEASSSTGEKSDTASSSASETKPAETKPTESKPKEKPKKKASSDD